MNIPGFPGFGTEEAHHEEPFDERLVFADRLQSIISLESWTYNANYAQFGPDAPAEELPQSHVGTVAITETTAKPEVSEPVEPIEPIELAPYVSPEIATQRQKADEARRNLGNIFGAGQ